MVEFHGLMDGSVATAGALVARLAGAPATRPCSEGETQEAVRPRRNSWAEASVVQI